jgi:glycerol-3-phosphate dehydrogenase
MDSSDYLRVELHNTASTEMVVKLDDFLRRRSKIALITRDEDVRSSKGLQEVADILFGADANKKLEEYFGTLPSNSTSSELS